MLELEVFNRAEEDHCLRIWVRGRLIYTGDRLDIEELKSMRDCLRNESEWLTDYLKEGEKE